MIDADDADADRSLIPSLKVPHLFDQIAHYPVDLLDHRLGKDLDLGSDFNGGYGTTRHFEACVLNGFYTRDELAEGPIAPTRRNALAKVLRIDNAVASLNTFNQLLRPRKGEEIFR